MMFRIAEHAKMGSIKSGMSKSLKFVASSVAKYRAFREPNSALGICGKLEQRETTDSTRVLEALRHENKGVR